MKLNFAPGFNVEERQNADNGFSKLKRQERLKDVLSKIETVTRGKLNSKQTALFFQELAIVDFDAAMSFAAQHKIRSSSIIRALSSKEFRDSNPEISKLVDTALTRNKEAFGYRNRRLISKVVNGEDLSHTSRPDSLLRNINAIIKRHGEKIIRSVKLSIPKMTSLPASTQDAIAFVRRLDALSKGRFYSGEVKRKLDFFGVKITPECREQYLSGATVAKDQLDELFTRTTPQLNTEQKDEIERVAKEKELSLVYSVQRNLLLEQLEEEIVASGLLPPGQSLILKSGEVAIAKRTVAEEEDLFTNNSQSTSLNTFHFHKHHLMKGIASRLDNCRTFRGRTDQRIIHTATVREEGPLANRKKIKNLTVFGDSGPLQTLREGFSANQFYEPVEHADCIIYPYKNQDKDCGFVVVTPDLNLRDVKLKQQKHKLISAGKDWIATADDQGNLDIHRITTETDTSGTLHCSQIKQSYKLPDASSKISVKLAVDDQGNQAVFVRDRERGANYILDQGSKVHAAAFMVSEYGDERVLVDDKIHRLIKDPNNNLALSLQTCEISSGNVKIESAISLDDFEDGQFYKSQTGRKYVKLKNQDGSQLFEIEDGGLRFISELPKLAIFGFLESNGEIYLIASESESHKEAIFNLAGKRVSAFYDSVEPCTQQGNPEPSFIVNDELEISRLSNKHFGFKFNRSQELLLNLYAAIKTEDLDLIRTTTESAAEFLNDTDSNAMAQTRVQVAQLSRIIQKDPELTSSPSLGAQTYADVYNSLYAAMSELSGDRFNFSDLLSFTASIATSGASMRSMPNLNYPEFLRPMGGNPREDLQDTALVMKLSEKHQGFIAGAVYFAYDQETCTYVKSSPIQGDCVFQDKSIGVCIPIAEPGVKQNLLKPIRAKVHNAELVLARKNVQIEIENSKGDVTECQTTKKTKEVTYRFRQANNQELTIHDTKSAYQQMLQTDPVLEAAAQPRLELPEDLKAFIDSISHLSPYQQVKAVQSFVKDSLYYDLDNGVVADEKSMASLSEKFELMRKRLEELKLDPDTAKTISDEKIFAGVCIDAAELTSALLSELGIASGIAPGYLAQGAEVLAGSAHAICIAALPDENNQAVLIEVDSTPEMDSEFCASILDLMMPILNFAEKKDDAPRVVSNGDMDETEDPTLTTEMQQTEIDLSQRDRIMISQFFDYLFFSGNFDPETYNTSNYSRVLEGVLAGHAKQTSIPERYQGPLSEVLSYISDNISKRTNVPTNEAMRETFALLAKHMDNDLSRLFA